MKTETIKGMGGTLFKTSEKLECSEGSKNLQLIIDGEASQEQEYRLMSHINECASCNSIFTLDKALKGIIKDRVQSRPYPIHLIENIRAKLMKND